MSALQDYLTQRRLHKDCLVMTHVVCGYPSFDDNWKELEIMQQHDVDMVELQFPFSEPSADGPLFVKANQEAIESGVTVQDCFDFMRKVTAHFSFKVIMMGYYNTVFKSGHKAFMQKLSNAGAVGYILPDLPVHEAQELYAIGAELELAPIVLMTPTNTQERLIELARSAEGFIYTVARRGVTGSQTDMDNEVADFVSRCRNVTDLPLAVGFGVSEKKDIEFIAKHADIAVIGTAALQAWESGREQALDAFFTQLLG